MNGFMTVLPDVPDWMNGASLDKFVPFMIDVMTRVSAGLYDFFVPLVSAFIWTLVGFNIMLFVIKQYVPQDWLDFLNIKNGGGYYDGKKTAELAWGIPKKLAQMMMRAALATTILLAVRPTFLTETIINPFLKLGSIYTESILNSPPGEGSPKAGVGMECNTHSFFSPEICNQMANPISGIIYKNNQVVTLGLDMMGVPSFITGGNPMSKKPDMGLWLFNFFVGAVLAITFFLSGLYIASVILQGILNFCFAIMLFPFRTFKWVMQQTDAWANPTEALKGIIDSLRGLVVAMVIGGIMTLINLSLIAALFGQSGISANLSSWSDKFMIALSSILALLVMTRLLEIAKEKMAKFGAPDETFYKNLTANAQTLGKTAVKLGGNIGKMLKK
ncbi:MAG: hypothetical protein LBH81_02355 [Rickettsiales bacterium]|jgi:hypothetical protein|nr:hypothetical protein [Rickettsiales bacterium]